MKHGWKILLTSIIGMIPGMIVDFLERASVAVAATRDKNLAPHIHGISGWRASEDRTQITCLVGRKFTDHLLPSLENNGRFALTVEQIGPHEAYQFKGSFVDSRPLSEADRALYEACRQRFVDAVVRLYRVPPEPLYRFVSEPGLALRFTVQEIFVQTPGPSAGKRLVPREEP